MFIEVTEILVCPACRPDQGLVAVVEEMRGRRVVEGYLGCPSCEARYPIRRGEVQFGSGVGAAAGGRAGGRSEPAEGGEPPPGATPGPGQGPPTGELAVQLAALLGLGEGGGVVLLGEGLAEAATALAGLAPGIEVVAVTSERSGRAPGESPGDPPSVTRIAGASAEALPIFPGTLRGAAVAGGSGAVVEECARVLAPGGRLVVLRPAPEIPAAVRRLPLELLAAESRALVAVRR